jgi:hypothetical protein
MSEDLSIGRSLNFSPFVGVYKRHEHVSITQVQNWFHDARAPTSAKPPAVRCGGKIVGCHGLGARATTLDRRAPITIAPGAHALGVLAASAPATTAPRPCGTGARDRWPAGPSPPFCCVSPVRPGATLEGRALHVRLFHENLRRVLLILNGLRSCHDQRALLGYYYPQSRRSCSHYAHIFRTQEAQENQSGILRAKIVIYAGESGYSKHHNSLA